MHTAIFDHLTVADKVSRLEDYPLNHPEHVKEMLAELDNVRFATLDEPPLPDPTNTEEVQEYLERCALVAVLNQLPANSNQPAPFTLYKRRFQDRLARDILAEVEDNKQFYIDQLRDKFVPVAQAYKEAVQKLPAQPFTDSELLQWEPKQFGYYQQARDAASQLKGFLTVAVDILCFMPSERFTLDKLEDPNLLIVEPENVAQLFAVLDDSSEYDDAFNRLIPNVYHAVQRGAELKFNASDAALDRFNELSDECEALTAEDKRAVKAMVEYWEMED